jgi:hypothetical protein
MEARAVAVSSARDYLTGEDPRRVFSSVSPLFITSYQFPSLGMYFRMTFLGGGRSCMCVLIIFWQWSRGEG